jgi:hypothetical protein
MTNNIVRMGKRAFGRWGQRLLAGGLFLAVFAFLGWSVFQQWDTLKSYPWQLNVGYVALASGFHSLALGVTFVVWHLMLRRLGRVDDARINAHIYYLSTLAKRIPSAIWYVGGRLVMYQRVGVIRSAVLNAIVLETVLIGGAGVLVYLALLPFYSWTSTGVTWLVAIVGILALLAFFVRPRWLLDVTNVALRRWHREPIQADVSRRDLLLWVGIYLIPWPLAGVSLFFMIRAMTPGTTADLVSIIGVSTLSMLVALVSLILPAGLGLKELTIAALMSPWLPLSVGVVVAIAYRVLQTLDEMVWAALVSGLYGRPPPSS